ncbi:YbgA family protein [Azomonas macrocytogenes]|uniref:Uncharacterized protein YbgA (DUF1722 family)/uncharacterized protein YbbK (DUF523 family) n=1 Tax=Azomonas macrocytogenes TaxID=69962 RepID=A0A839T6Q0_AZOMA|nr:DUF523 and DUF1722 domain-containing protein [Azomonas macrocytogenes]MBB3103353.1 uncharacterized protein YbgA (DUF1722 family)/uncharacterized protein YbbK (DUF523 family) [Azomonas macrocytogenes]
MENLNRPKIKIAISACLLGEPVRYNGGHKESRLCTQTLARHFDFVPVCPEVAIGLGTPRESIRLVGDPENPRAQGTLHHEHDVTEPLAEYGRHMAGQLRDVCGYILMQKSPSCGMERVKVYQENGYSSDSASGIYAQAFRGASPDLPMEEDGRLNDPVLRENFLARVFAYARWQQLLSLGLTRKAVLDFHSSYKFQLLAHDPRQYRQLGRLLASIGEQPIDQIGPHYFSLLMQALKKTATRGTHANVLQHMSGYLKQFLDPGDRREIQNLIAQYHQGTVPLVVPLTLLKHHLRKHPDPYLGQQAYLQPHPDDLSLRNAI